jgi:ureidoglycolate hydrolase
LEARQTGNEIMKQEDFDRFKSVCEKEGFELLNVSHEDNEKYFVIAKKKDEWEGVEFAECIRTNNPTAWTFGKIYKAVDKITGSLPIHDNNLVRRDVVEFDKPYLSENHNCFQPSTEQDYVEQLKKEAFERFGEIKEGDRFIAPSGNQYQIPNNYGIQYFKNADDMRFSGISIYKSGKWAKKIPERVKVSINDEGIDLEKYTSDHSFMVEFLVSDRFLVTEKIRDEWASFLASQLEEYLNKP